MTQSRYEYWCQLRVPARSWFRGRDAAEAKRKRKAAKRRRDAERTEEGKRNDLWWAMYDHAIEQSREVAP